MQEAIKEAKFSIEENEIPVGAIIVFEGKIIARAHNEVEKLKDPTAHAELIAITQAANFLNNWRLNNVFLYVTLEPCLMCTGAIILARIPHLIYGVDDNKIGAVRNFPYQNRPFKVNAGILANEYKILLTSFFKTIRNHPI